jgi:hypothetical protein
VEGVDFDLLALAALIKPRTPSVHERECVPLASSSGVQPIKCRGEGYMGAEPSFTGLVVFVSIAISILVGLILVSVVF